MNSLYDHQLASVNNLQWLPWIGKFYGASPDTTALIIGESHYIYEEEDEDTAEYLKNSDFTRYFINNNGVIAHPKKQFILRNIERCLFNNDSPSPNEKTRLWNSCAFMNFVQREMVSAGDRPLRSDFNNGWPVFFKVINVLKPQVCIFAGVSAANSEPSFKKYAVEEGFDTNGIQWASTPINGTYGRVATLEREGEKVTLVFIKHPSQRFTCAEWKAYLSAQISSYINSLQLTNDTLS